MITYSVTVVIDREIEGDWYPWMCDSHIPDVMETGCFVDSRIRRVLDPTDRASAIYNIEYTCESPETLASYQSEHAPRLQAEHQERFDGRFLATRRVYEEIR